jgi:uncharacterized membrane protein
MLMKPALDYPDTRLPLPAIRRIGATQPLRWLRAGWHDLPIRFLAGLRPALRPGRRPDHPGHARPAASADGIDFRLLPHRALLAAGLNELSRRTAAGEKILFIDSVRCFKRNGESLALFGLILALVALMWERFSAVAFALLGSSSGIDAGVFISSLILSGEHTAFIATWFVIGGLLALGVFAISVISVPLMLDHDADVPTAILSSLRAFAANTGPLLLWAALLVGLTLLGFATLLFGLVVIMPYSAMLRGMPTATL